jgi:uncharacterized protein
MAQDSAAQPSFDCTLATEPVEALICGDATLADLDRALADAYHTALAASTGEAQAVLQEEQRAWAGHRSVSCGINADPAIEIDDAIGCLIALYRGRIAELDPGESGGNGAVSQSGYGWLMGDWNVAAIRKPPADAVRGRSEGAAWPHHAFRRGADRDPRWRRVFLSALQRRARTRAGVRRSQRIPHRRDGAADLPGYCVVGCCALD